MSEGGGGEVKNGEVGEVSIDVPKTPEPAFQPPEITGVEYDENGQMKPFICICPAKPPDPDDGEKEENEKPIQNGQNNESTKENETKEVENTTKEQPKEEQPNSDSTNSASSPTVDEKTQNKTFSEQFKLFSKFGDCKSDGRLMSLSQSDKWMKQAKVIDGKHITTTDTGIHFKKLKSLKVSETDYKKFLDDLAKTKKMNVENIKKKMVTCGAPGLSSQTSGAKAPSAFDRLTDTSKYTGCHKQRFDESGKGRGIAGRKDLHDTSGYVSGYMNKNTYDKKNPTK